MIKRTHPDAIRPTKPILPVAEKQSEQEGKPHAHKLSNRRSKSPVQNDTESTGDQQTVGTGGGV